MIKVADADLETAWSAGVRRAVTTAYSWSRPGVTESVLIKSHHQHESLGVVPFAGIYTCMGNVCSNPDPVPFAGPIGFWRLIADYVLVAECPAGLDGSLSFCHFRTLSSSPSSQHAQFAR